MTAPLSTWTPVCIRVGGSSALTCEHTQPKFGCATRRRWPPSGPNMHAYLQLVGHHSRARDASIDRGTGAADTCHSRYMPPRARIFTLAELHVGGPRRSDSAAPRACICMLLHTCSELGPNAHVQVAWHTGARARVLASRAIEGSSRHVVAGRH